MAWIELHEQFRNHPKVEALADALEIRPAYARGHIVSLWLWAASYAQDGDLSSFTTRQIARAVDYEGDPDEIVRLLVETGWLDRDGDGLMIHDWNDHGLRLLRSMRERQKNHREGIKAEKPHENERCDDTPAPSEAACDSHVTVTLPSRPTDLTDHTDHTDQKQQIPESPPLKSQNLEQHLLAMWGREGRLGHLMLGNMVELGKKHGWPALERAISEAATHNARSVAYVKGVLEPKPKPLGATPVYRGGRAPVIDTTVDSFIERQRRREEKAKAVPPQGSPGTVQAEAVGAIKNLVQNLAMP